MATLYRELSREHALIRYDARGNGLSDREVEDVSFETFVSDLESVVDAAGLERFALLGISQGCAVAVAYAVRHPERVTHLILYGGFALGWAKRASSAAQKEERAAMLTLMRLGWGQENPAFRQLFTSQFIPDATKEQADWFNELQRISTSPEDAVRNYVANGDADVRALLAQVAIPTLVMHAREGRPVPSMKAAACSRYPGRPVCAATEPESSLPGERASLPALLEGIDCVSRISTKAGHCAGYVTHTASSSRLRARARYLPLGAD